MSAEKIAAEFYSAEAIAEHTESESTATSATHKFAESLPGRSEKMYRDVLLNLRPRGTKFICEVQITLTGIAILKKSRSGAGG